MKQYTLYKFDGVKSVQKCLVDLPEPSDAEVLVQIKSTAICTLEQRIYSGVKKMYPFAGGHEIAGLVVKTGPLVKNLKASDHVAIRLLNSCGECHYCHRGFSHLCVSSYKSSAHEGHLGPGGFSEYMLVNVAAAFKIDEKVDFAHACLCEPVACCVHSVRRAQIDLAETVVVIGVGFMGAIHIQLAKLQGARVIACEIDEERLSLAKKMGADILINSSKVDAISQVKEITDGRGADVVFCLNAIKDLAKQAVAMLDKRGRAIMYSSFHPAGEIDIDPDRIHSDESVVTGAVNPETRDFYSASKLIAYGFLKIEDLIDSRMKMTDLEAALERSLLPGTYRVIVQN